MPRTDIPDGWQLFDSEFSGKVDSIREALMEAAILLLAMDAPSELRKQRGQILIDMLRFHADALEREKDQIKNDLIPLGTTPKAHIRALTKRLGSKRAAIMSIVENARK